MGFSWILFLTLALIFNIEAVEQEATEVEPDCKHYSGSCGTTVSSVSKLHDAELDSTEASGRQDRNYEHRYPHGKDMIETSFRCHGKPYIPGFYADMEADCQIFHLCLRSAVEHYMCPKGTAFNQQTLVCEHNDKVQCHVTPTYYVMNADLHLGHPIIPGTKEIALNEDADKWLYDIIRRDRQNTTDKDFLERNLIRMLILMQFIDVSDVLASILEEEESSEPHRKERSLNSTKLAEVLDHILQEVFPLLPVKFSSSAEESSEKDFVEASGHRKEKVQRHSMFSKSPSRKALEIAEILIAVIGQTAGSISSVSRSNIVANHVNYIYDRFSIPKARSAD